MPRCHRSRRIELEEGELKAWSMAARPCAGPITVFDSYTVTDTAPVVAGRPWRQHRSVRHVVGGDLVSAVDAMASTT
jgi:hypothetical protein